MQFVYGCENYFDIIRIVGKIIDFFDVYNFVIYNNRISKQVFIVSRVCEVIFCFADDVILVYKKDKIQLNLIK